MHGNDGYDPFGEIISPYIAPDTPEQLTRLTVSLSADALINKINTSNDGKYLNADKCNSQYGAEHRVQYRYIPQRPVGLYQLRVLQATFGDARWGK